jgi:hypothetical protein
LNNCLKDERQLTRQKDAVLGAKRTFPMNLKTHPKVLWQKRPGNLNIKERA